MITKLDELSREWVYSDRLTGVLCGDFLETIETPERQQGPLPAKAETNTPNEETLEERLERSTKRAQRTIRRLTNSNRLYILYTLTYAVAHPKYFQGERPFDIVPVDIQKNRDCVILHWKEFARKMRKYATRHDTFFRYVAVIEKHTGKRAKDTTIKKDTYHIHFVSDLFWPKRLLQSKWRHGFCNYADWQKGRKSSDMQDTYDAPPPDNPGAYMSKYIGKDSDRGANSTDFNKKRYWASQHLHKPVPMAGDDIRTLLTGTFTEVFRRVFKVTVDGKTFTSTLATYRLKDSPFKTLAGIVYNTPTEAHNAKKLSKILWADVKCKLQFIKELQDYEHKIGGENHRTFALTFDRMYHIVKGRETPIETTWLDRERIREAFESLNSPVREETQEGQGNLS